MLNGDHEERVSKLKIFFFVISTERLALDLCNPEGKLDSKVELVVSIFEGIYFTVTIIISVHNNQDERALSALIYNRTNVIKKLI